MRAWLLLAAAVSLTPAALAAQGGPSTSPLVTTEGLAARLADPDLVVLHVGDEASYAQGHVPGARLFPFGAFAVERNDLSTEMPDPAAFEAALESAGVSQDSRIVVYTTSHPPQLAARLYLTLDHFGLGGQASLLDGGLRAWGAEGRPLETAAPAPAVRGSLDLRAGASGLLVDHAFVAGRVADGGAVVIDARDPQFWTGEQRNTQRAARAGRVPGAKNVPFRTLVDDSGRLLDLEALRATFARAGVAEGRPVVVYCHVGQQASLVLLGARLLGHDARLYDGSYEEWSRRLDLPVETGGGG